jgi:hypothetical protein
MFKPKGTPRDLAIRPLILDDEKDKGTGELKDGHTTHAEGYVTAFDAATSEDSGSVIELTTVDKDVFRYFTSKAIDDAVASGDGILKESVKNRYIVIDFKGRSPLAGGRSFKNFKIQLYPDEVLGG